MKLFPHLNSPMAKHSQSKWQGEFPSALHCLWRPWHGTTPLLNSLALALGTGLTSRSRTWSSKTQCQDRCWLIPDSQPEWWSAAAGQCDVYWSKNQSWQVQLIFLQYWKREFCIQNQLNTEVRLPSSCINSSMMSQKQEWQHLKKICKH